MWGELGGTRVEVMLDSGSSVSLVQQQVLSRAGDVEQIEGEKTPATSDLIRSSPTNSGTHPKLHPSR